MDSRPFNTIISPGYIVDIFFRKGRAPEKVLSDEYIYYEDYYEVVITVTPDNLSVAEQVHKLYLVPHEPCAIEHAPLTHDCGLTFGICYDQKILNVVFGCKTLTLQHEEMDYDVIILTLSESSELDKNLIHSLFKHDKEDILFTCGDFG